MTHIENEGPNPGANDPLIEDARHAAVGDGGSSVQDGVPTETLTDSPSRLPKRIGQYHIKRVIASGGMGTVYEAVQEKPRRPVALKLMKQGIASRSALRRFEYESQILARLRHPGIAQVYDAGTHKDDSGTTPYFAMEYIPNALPITKYVKEKKLGTRERMALFAQVCEAVHHGHQKGIIHRDLKPSNILVDAHGQVKIIDFGVARSTDSDLAVTTLQTDVGQLIGTLQYMSPEQCAADPHDIDTRSDVYALGVVFYELLTEHLPYDVRKKAVFEATRVIREEQPTRLSTINRTLRGDVETIALKALEKERDRRYQSATEFGQDIRRYLGNEAITARRASVMYQFRVLVRRNKPIFAAIAVVFVVLIGATAVSTTLYFHSQREARKSETTVAFLQDMLRSVDPTVADGKEVSVRSILDNASAKLDSGELDHVPEVELQIRWTLGETYFALSRAGPEGKASTRQFERAVELSKLVYGEGDERTIAADRRLASQLPPEQSVLRLRRNVELARRNLGPNHQSTIASVARLGVALFYRGEFEEAETLLLEVIELDQSENRTLAIKAALNLATMLSGYFEDNDEKLAQAEVLLRQAINIRQDLNLERDVTMYAEGMLAEVLLNRRKLDEAEVVARQVLQERSRVFQPDHLFHAYSWRTLLQILQQAGKTEAATQMVTERVAAIDASIDSFGPDALDQYAWALAQCPTIGPCDPQAAVRYAERAILLTDGAAAEMLSTLALAYRQSGNAAKAVETYEEYVSSFPAGSPGRTKYEAKLAEYRAALSERESAEPTDQTRPASTETKEDSSSPSHDPTDSGG